MSEEKGDQVSNGENAQAAEKEDQLTLEARLKVYDVYTRLLIGEADRVWSRFAAYLTVNTAVGGLGTWIIKQGLTERNVESATLGLLGVLIGVFGAFLSCCWLRTIREGEKWQRFYVGALRKLEEGMKKEVNLWSRPKDPSSPGGILKISADVTHGFIVAWVLLIVFALAVIVRGMWQ